MFISMYLKFLKCAILCRSAGPAGLQDGMGHPQAHVEHAHQEPVGLLLLVLLGDVVVHGGSGGRHSPLPAHRKIDR